MVWPLNPHYNIVLTVSFVCPFRLFSSFVVNVVLALAVCCVGFFAKLQTTVWYLHLSFAVYSSIQLYNN